MQVIVDGSWGWYEIQGGYKDQLSSFWETPKLVKGTNKTKAVEAGFYHYKKADYFGTISTTTEGEVSQVSQRIWSIILVC